jgi:hypothetical protein
MLFPGSSVVHWTTAVLFVMEVIDGGEVICGAVVSAMGTVEKQASTDGLLSVLLLSGPLPAASVDPTRK